MTEKTSISISESLKDFLKAKFGNVSLGITTGTEVLKAADSLKIDVYGIADQLQFLQQVRRASLLEIKGIFTPEEWKMFADILNGTMITAEFRCLQQGLIAEIEDSEHFEFGASKWGVSVPEVSEKIVKLTGAQIDAIYYRCEQFWKSDNLDLEQWSKW